MASVTLRLLFIVCIVVSRADEDLRDFDFERDPDEVMIAQESRHYQTIVKPPVRIVKPTGVTNSHRPQYNLDSLENDGLEDFFEPTSRTVEKNYKSSSKIRAQEGMVKDAVLRAMERKDHVGKFAQILPIIRAMSGSQRLALASLVASQVSTPPGRPPLNLAQVRSMFGNTGNTTNLMLPILLDMANLIRRAVRPGKEVREAIQPYPPLLLRRYTAEEYLNQFRPQNALRRTYTEENTDGVRQPAALIRRSYTEDDALDDDMFELGVEPAPTQTFKQHVRSFSPETQKNSIKTNTDKDSSNDTKQVTVRENSNITNDVDNRNLSRMSTSTTTEASTSAMPKTKPGNISRSMTISSSDNTTLDLMADSTNQTLAQGLPVAEKLRALNRYVDRKGNLIRRGTYPPKPYTSPTLRRTTAEPFAAISRKRPAPARKLPLGDTKCELFTNTLCLLVEDYPSDAIVQSIRRNKAAAGALLADFKDPGEGALDGVTAAQESKYTTDHYLVSNRRGDTANRDFAGAGEAGFMCPSTVKYARPQRARATSGQWKYIVNTGEHTQTLRLEKCLKPKESCTYLTDNFKSKCVQVYNYHRLLTWDQQNGLHMDIFKVPTCCSCHIEGYSVAFPPLGHRIHETSSEHFPGEDLSSETGNHAFESVQSSIQRPTITKTPPFSHSKPESFPPFADNSHNLISGSPFSHGKHHDNDETGPGNINPQDSYGNSYFPDSFNQATSIRNIRRPLAPRSPASADSDSVTLPSYLEPPTPSASNSFSFVKEPTSKFNKNSGSPFKRGTFRPSRRPIRKKISGGPDDLVSSGSSAVEALANSNTESVEYFEEYLEEPQIGQANVITNTHQQATHANQQATHTHQQATHNHQQTRHIVNHSSPPKLRATISPKLQAVVTSEILPTTANPQEQTETVNENFTSNGKRINYNYHPIIDFFEEQDREIEEDSIDREDSESFVAPSESDWKPINHLPSRNIQSSNLLGRKKHK